MTKVLIVAILLCADAWSQSGWKRYSYPEDGFVISAPRPPKVKPDEQLPEATAYVFTFPGITGEPMGLHVKKGSDCEQTLAKLRQLESSGGDNEEVAGSFKDITIQGHAGIEYEVAWNSNYFVFYRWFCADNRAYGFAIQESKKHSLPELAKRVLGSFHLLNAAGSR